MVTSASINCGFLGAGLFFGIVSLRQALMATTKKISTFYRLAWSYPVIVPLVLIPLAGNSFLAPANVKEAKRLFKQKCSKCHGQEGAGNNYGQIIGATKLSDPEWQQKVYDKRLINSIKHGRGQMPAFGEKLSEDQITSLVSYVRALGK